jgi:hypothetical protein
MHTKPSIVATSRSEVCIEKLETPEMFMKDFHVFFSVPEYCNGTDMKCLPKGCVKGFVAS